MVSAGFLDLAKALRTSRCALAPIEKAGVLVLSAILDCFQRVSTSVDDGTWPARAMNESKDCEPEAATKTKVVSGSTVRRLWIGCSALLKEPDREVVVADWFQSTAPATRVLDTDWRMRDTTVARALGF
jgi:hypothetical protein